MNAAEIRARIVRILGKIIAAKGLPAPDLGDDTVLLGGSLGIDSLDLAELIVTMTEECRKDPFAAGLLEFRTVGELVRLYAD